MTLHVGVGGWLLGPASGANRRLLALLANVAPLLGDGERVTLLHATDKAPPPLPPRIATRAVPIPPRPTLRRAFAERTVLPRVCRELAFDVFDHALLPAPRLPCPLVLTLHDLRDADGHGSAWRPRWLARAVLRAACRRAAALVVPSEFTGDRLRVHVPSADAVVVPGGVALPDAAAAAPAPADAPPHLLHVGHLEPRKNVAVLLQALALLPADRRPLLCLAGADAGEGARLDRLARRLGIAASVRRLGAVDDAELARRLARSFAVAMPSRYEGFGLPVLEALANGRPALVAAAGALPELLPRGDALGCAALPPDDAAAWAAAIDAARAAAAAGGDDVAARAARRAHAARFSWRDAAAALLAVWRQAAWGDGQRTNCTTSQNTATAPTSTSA